MVPPFWAPPAALDPDVVPPVVPPPPHAETPSTEATPRAARAVVLFLLLIPLLYETHRCDGAPTLGRLPRAIFHVPVPAPAQGPEASSVRLGVEGVTQAVAEQVEAQHDGGDRQTGDEEEDRDARSVVDRV